MESMESFESLVMAPEEVEPYVLRFIQDQKKMDFWREKGFSWLFPMESFPRSCWPTQTKMVLYRSVWPLLHGRGLRYHSGQWSGFTYRRKGFSGPHQLSKGGGGSPQSSRHLGADRLWLCRRLRRTWSPRPRDGYLWLPNCLGHPGLLRGEVLRTSSMRATSVSRGRSQTL